MPQPATEPESSKSNDVGRPGATKGTPLPPSVEKAYYRKCIELKRRINEVEDSNDVFRLRKARINRAILKMRLERAFLLDQLQQRMDTNVDESDRSTSPPPTRADWKRLPRKQPQDKPLRSKRSHRKNTPPAQGGNTPSRASPASTQPPALAMQRISSANSATESRSNPVEILPSPSGVNGSGPGSALAPPHPLRPSPSSRPLERADERRSSHARQDNAGPSDLRRSLGSSGRAAETSAAASETRAKQNGERRSSPAAETRDAPSASAEAGGGFTAVNR